MDVNARVKKSVVRTALRLHVKSLGFTACAINRKAKVRVLATRANHDTIGPAIARAVIKDIPSMKRVTVSIKTPKHDKVYRMDKPCGCKHEKAAMKKAAAAAAKKTAKKPAKKAAPKKRAARRS